MPPSLHVRNLCYVTFITCSLTTFKVINNIFHACHWWGNEFRTQKWLSIALNLLTFSCFKSFHGIVHLFPFDLFVKVKDRDRTCVTPYIIFTNNFLLLCQFCMSLEAVVFTQPKVLDIVNPVIMILKIKALSFSCWGYLW